MVEPLFPRSSGILLHPTSLPGRYGIGDLGEWAYRFADWLASAGQTVWQILPLGPTSYGDSPYQTLSAFAGNPNLISLDKLVDDGYLMETDLSDAPDFPEDRVDYGWIINYHRDKLDLAAERFATNGTPEQQADFNNWTQENAYWLADYALFVALKDAHDGRPWVEWPQTLALRDSAALAAAQQTHAKRIHQHRFRQWMFYKQWYELKTYVNDKGIRFVGDIPIFVAHDSSDVWANTGSFYLDESGNPEVIAGVPPDYFSVTGQRWGNPLYRWDVMQADGYSWWISRLRATLSLVDAVRIDHFRGFEAYWSIPAEEETAINGAWIPGPGADLFKAIAGALGGSLPIIAEDLGVITAGVEALRDDFGLPGMKVLQFAWSDPTNPFLPHNHIPNAVVYSGTHDNNTSVGWWNTEVDYTTKQFMFDYLDRAEIYEINWALIRLGMASVGHTFVATMQDILGLGAEGRMNTPGLESGNWTWRMTAADFANAGVRDRLAHLTYLYRRRPDQQETLYGDVAVKS